MTILRSSLLPAILLTLVSCTNGSPEHKFTSLDDAQSKLSVGMDIDEVGKMLGKPDKDEATTSADGKEKHTFFYYDPKNREKILTIIIVAGKVTRIGRLGM